MDVRHVLGDLARLRGERVELEKREAQLVVDARAAGATWDEVADALGLSRSYVHRRYGGACVAAGAGRVYVRRAA